MSRPETPREGSPAGAAQPKAAASSTHRKNWGHLWPRVSKLPDQINMHSR